VIRRGKIDEVLFFVPHAEERSPGLGTDAENSATVKLLRPVFARLRARGVMPSINVWWTVSFSEFPGYPRDLRGKFKFRWAVAADGRKSISAACPGCPEWRAQVVRMYKAYAGLKPERIWIDDDVRMTLRADMHCPCYCDVCMAEMSRRTGSPCRRDKLTAAILADPPNSVREAWLEYQHTLERDNVAAIAQGVHEVSPETRVCLMHSGAEIHAAEGRRWSELVSVLGNPAPTLRPGIGPYVEVTGPNAAGAFNCARVCQAAIPAGTQLAPEIENYPHSRLGKSVAIVKANLVLSQLLGIPEMTFSIYRFGGRLDLETKREDPWSPLLAEMKPELQAIADLGIDHRQSAGVSLFWHEDGARHARYVEKMPKPIFLFRVRPWDQALPLMGVATRYGLGKLNAFAGEQIECLTDSELSDVFSGGVLLDARAAESLVLMGKGGLAGIHGRTANTTATIETVEDASFGGLKDDVMNLRYTSQAWQFKWRPCARRVSVLRGYDNRVRGHGVMLYENTQGGRVVVYPFDSQAGETISLGVGFQPFESPSFICRPRQAQLMAALEWAGRRPLPLAVVDSPMVYPLLVDQGDRLIVGMWNLMPDPVECLSFRLGVRPFSVRKVRVLNADGRWTAAATRVARERNGSVTVKTRVKLNYLDTAVLVLEGTRR